MKTPFLPAAIAFALAGPTTAFSTPPHPAIEIVRAWIAPPPGGAPTAAGYGIIKNEGRSADTFIGASTPAAEKLELHSVSNTGGIMRMRPAVGGVAIGPGQALTLAPGGAYHFMFVHPKRALKSGERIPATLTFARAGAVKTTFVVQAAPGSGMTMR